MAGVLAKRERFLGQSDGEHGAISEAVRTAPAFSAGEFAKAKRCVHNHPRQAAPAWPRSYLRG